MTEKKTINKQLETFVNEERPLRNTEHNRIIRG